MSKTLDQYTNGALELRNVSDALAGLGDQKKSVEGLLDALWKIDPTLRQNFIIAIESRSLHYASRQYPRMIFFSSKLVLALGTDPSDPAYHKVELYNLDKTDTDENVMLEIDFLSKDLSIDQRPHSCSSCHGVEKKPIWDSYATWPGTYPARASEGGHAGIRQAFAKEQSPRLQYLLNNIDDEPKGDANSTLTARLIEANFERAARRWAKRLTGRDMIHLTFVANCAGSDQLTRRVQAFPELKSAVEQLMGYLKAESDRVFRRADQVQPELRPDPSRGELPYFYPTIDRLAYFLLLAQF